jgi:general secretion pathway protein F/type IV pilus assembly protein PilC
MPVFEYIALNASGQRVGGVLAGASEQAVLTELEARALTPVSIEAKGERRRRGRVSARRLAGSYLQLSDLLRAGVPLLRGLKLLGNRKSDPRLSAVFRDITEEVSQGSELGDAMSKHPSVFPKVHIAMVRAGEKGGFLEQVMARLGRFVMGQAELRSKVIGNLIYPTVLVVFGVIVLSVIFGVFVPKFRPMYAAIPPAKMPAVSTFVFVVSALVGRFGPWTLGVLVVAAIVLWRATRRARVRRRIAEWLTRAPVYGPLVRSLAAARFCRMLGTMLANGIPMLTAMQIARDAAGNVLMEEAVQRATEAVRSGQPLAGPLAESGLFEEEVIEMISVGESANNLDEVLTTVAETIEARVDRMLTTAIRLLEPLLLVTIAAVVAVVAAGLILPMTQMQGGV